MRRERDAPCAGGQRRKVQGKKGANETRFCIEIQCVPAVECAAHRQHHECSHKQQQTQYRRTTCTLRCLHSRVTCVFVFPNPNLFFFHFAFLLFLLFPHRTNEHLKHPSLTATAMGGWRRVLRCAVLSRVVLFVLALAASTFPDYDSSQESLLTRLSDLPLFALSFFPSPAPLHTALSTLLTTVTLTLTTIPSIPHT